MRMAGSFWSSLQISALGRCFTCVWLVWVGVAYNNLEGEGGIGASQKCQSFFQYGWLYGGLRTVITAPVTWL